MRKTINEVKAVEAEVRKMSSNLKEQMAMISHSQGLCAKNDHYISVLIIAKRRILRIYTSTVA